MAHQGISLTHSTAADVARADHLPAAALELLIYCEQSRARDWTSASLATSPSRLVQRRQRPAAMPNHYRCSAA